MMVLEPNLHDHNLKLDQTPTQIQALDKKSVRGPGALRIGNNLSLKSPGRRE